MSATPSDSLNERDARRLLWRERFVSFTLALRDPLGALGFMLVVLVIFGALFAPYLTPYDPIKMAPADRFQGMSFDHFLGTDQLGRDLFTRVLFGARIALYVALVATTVSLSIGVLLGLIAGFAPRWLDNLLLLVMDAIRSYPTVMLGLSLVVLIGPSLEAVMLVVVLYSVPSYARIVRTQTLSMKSAEFVLSARALGAGIPRILAHHILPNIIGPLLILASMEIPVVITIEAGMSFLGLGVAPPTPSWGTILNDGYAYIRESSWPAIAGGLPIIITTLGFTFLGEALRDAFDPKLRKEAR